MADAHEHLRPSEDHRAAEQAIATKIGSLLRNKPHSYPGPLSRGAIFDVACERVCAQCGAVQFVALYVCGAWNPKAALLFREKTRNTTEVVRRNDRIRGLSAARAPPRTTLTQKTRPWSAASPRTHALGMPNIKGSGTIASRLLRRRRSASEGCMDSKSAICAAGRARG